MLQLSGAGRTTPLIAARLVGAAVHCWFGQQCTIFFVGNYDLFSA